MFTMDAVFAGETRTLDIVTALDDDNRGRSVCGAVDLVALFAR